MKKILFLLSVIVGLANAGSAHAAVLWSERKNVSAVQVVEQGGIIISFDSSLAQPCTPAHGNAPNAVYVYPGQLGLTAEGVKAITSLALTALSTGMKLSVSYDAAANYCWVANAVIFKS